MLLCCFEDKLPIQQIARIARLSEEETIDIIKEHGTL